MRLDRLARATAALAATAAACSPFRFEAQDVSVRHDVENDVLELGILYEGLHARAAAGDGMQEALDTVTRLAAGERVFVLVDWPFVFDFDRTDPATELEVEGLSSEAAERARALFESVEIDGVELIVDENERLGAWQRVRMRDASAGVATVNGLINEVLRIVEQAEKVEVGDWDVDARTRELMLAHAHRNDPWIVLKDGGFELRVPFSRAQGAQALRALLPVVRDPEEGEAQRALAEVLAGLTEVELAEELLVLRFLPGPSGAVRFRFDRTHWVYDGSLREKLSEAGFSGVITTVEAARARSRGED